MVEEVVHALKESAKGKLDYGRKLRNQPSLQKLHVLDSLNPLPRLSPEVESFLFAMRPEEIETTSAIIVEDVDHPIEQKTEDVDHPIEQKMANVDHPIEQKMENVDHPIEQRVEGFSESSIISDVDRERYDYEESLDDRLMKEATEALDEQRHWFQHRLQELNMNCRKKLELERTNLQRRRKQYQEAIRLEELRKSVAIEEWMQVTLEAYRAEDERVEAKLAAGELQAQRITMLKQEQMEVQCKQYHEECKKLSQMFVACFQDCKYPQHLQEIDPSKQGSAIKSCKDLQAQLSALEQSGSPLHENQMDDLKCKLNKLKLLLENMRMAVQKANILGAEQAERELLHQKAELEQRLKHEEDERNRLKEEQKLIKKHKVEPKQQSRTVPASDVSSSTNENESLDLGMPKSMVSYYSKLQDNLVQTSSFIASFAGSKDPATKKYRFDLQKAVNITINSISASSGESLIEKINRLQALLGGQSVDVMGKSVNVSRHPEARLYCCNLLAQKLVKQGEDQVSSNIEAAFPLAAVAIGLWSKYPEVGELMLAHFHSTCPCLVPLYVKKTSDMTDIDHMKLQGYKVSSGGKVETEDMFLHRVRGVVRLYAAIISSPQLPMDHMHAHPHGLNCGWAWLARVLNMEPHPTLTAAALGDFLEITGHVLMKKFGRQFKKMLHTLCSDFILKMERYTPSSQRGPISRLTQLLQTSISSGIFPEPKGYLHIGFWRTRTKGISYA